MTRNWSSWDTDQWFCSRDPPAGGTLFALLHSMPVSRQDLEERASRSFFIADPAAPPAVPGHELVFALFYPAA